MKKLPSLFAVLLLSFIWLTSCEKNSSASERGNVNFKYYENLSNEEFQEEIKEFITLPDDYSITDKTRKIVFENISLYESIEIMRKKGYHWNISKQELKYLEEYGMTANKRHENILQELDIDLNLSEKEMIRQAEEKNNANKNSRNAGLTYVPHYYEWNTSENPNGYYWCGHASLKCVAHKHGAFKTLGQIHSAFSNNSAGYRNDRCNDGMYCSSVMDLLWASINQNNSSLNYNYPNTTKEYISSLQNFYQRIRDGVTYSKPLIAPSYFLQPYGHFYAVVGFITRYKSDGSIDYNASEVYLRDVAIPSSTTTFWDQVTSAQNFYNQLMGSYVLFVRP